MSKHYWLVALNISFVHEGRGMDTSVNTLINNEQPFVTKKMLENAQVQSQIQLAKNLGDQLPQVQHVYVQSVSYLGEMTEPEFLGESVQ